MKKYDPYNLPGTDMIWTDLDLAKFVLIAFVAGVVVGWIV